MEATGGYERLPFGVLWAAGVPAAIVNPRAVRRFAEAMGILEKTDRIDTGVIAWFAEVKRIVPQPPAAPAQQQLAALVTRLHQLTELRTAQSNQRRLVTDPVVRGSFDALLQLIAGQIRELADHIAQLIDRDPLWQKLDAAFRTIKGVADRTVARLLAELPEIGTLSNKAAAKLAGLAPIARDSGKLAGKRPVRGGPQRHPRDPLRRRRRGPPIRSRLYRLPPAVDPGGQAKKADPRRPRPQTARPPQCQSPRRPPRICHTRLTDETVAHPPGPAGQARGLAAHAAPVPSLSPLEGGEGQLGGRS
jgi:transposase